jgi:outer membrane protein TolC
MKRLCLLAALLCAGLLSSAKAETMSLADCLKRAQQRSVQVILSELAQRQAKAGLDAAKSRRLPQLSAVGALEKSDDAAKQLEGSNAVLARIEQAIYPLSADWVRVQQQAAGLEAAGLARLETGADVELAVKQLYFSILNADEAVASLGRVREQFDRLRETIVPRFAVGRVPHFDVIKVKSATSDLARAGELIEADRAAKKSELAQLIGERAEADLKLKPLAALPALPDTAAVQEQLQSNPTLRVLSQQITANELGIQAAKRERFPSLVTAFDYGDSGTRLSSMPPGWDVTMALRLPLYDWGTIASRVSEQEAQTSLSRNQLQLQEQRLRTQLVEAGADARAHLADYRRLTELVSETHEAALASIDQYRRGALGILEATDALNLWLQASLNGRSAYFSYLSDLARLERLSGGRIQVAYGD